MGRINWSFENLNVQISSCLLATANLTISKNFSNENYSIAYKGINVSIDDTSLGYLRADNVSQITIRNSNITDRDVVSNSSFIVLWNSNIIISDSTFTNNSIKIKSIKPTLLNAFVNSSISIVNCIVSENTGYVSIIQVTNSSSLNLTSSYISYNKIISESELRGILFMDDIFYLCNQLYIYT